MTIYERIKNRLENLECKTNADDDRVYDNIKLIEFLEICPYLDVVSEKFGMKSKSIYVRLSRILTKKELSELLEDLKHRRNEILDSLKQEYKEKLPERDWFC